MPTKEGRGGTLYVDGVAISEIPEFKIDESEVSECNEKFVRLDPEPREFSFSVELNKIQRLKLFGIYDYCRLHCPNRRVIHLMQYGKSYRVRLKNTKRAMRIMEKINIIERIIQT